MLKAILAKARQKRAFLFMGSETIFRAPLQESRL